MERGLIGSIVVALALIALPSNAQTTDEHESHHPGADAAGTPAAPAVADGAPMAEIAGQPAAAGMAPNAPMAAPAAASGAPGAPAMAGGMGGMMDMMSQMMPPAAAKTPIYPSLMTLPALTPAMRAEIDALSSQQLDEGMARLATGAESLERAAHAGDNVAMQQALGLMREGLDQMGAGIAARRVLSDGKAPRNLALDWFRREMNLASPITADSPQTSGGVKAFHLVTMLLLVAFAVAMVVIYVLKMRRAAALFGRLESGSGGLPPGSSPPLSGPPGRPPATPSASGKPPPTEPNDTPNTPADTSAAASAVQKVEPAAADADATSVAPPVTAKWLGQLRVGSVIVETPSVKTLRLLPASGAGLLPFTFLPGQFLNLSLWIGGAKMNRSYSISSSPTQRGFVDITVKREPRGAVSRHLDDLLKVGDVIDVGGPVGKFTFTGAEASSIVLIAGGVGVTPMMSIARTLTESAWPGDIYFFYACRAPPDFIFAADLFALQQRNPHLHVTVTMEKPEGTDWAGPIGRITGRLLTEAVPALTTRRVHLCGPPVMMQAVKALLTELGVPPEQVKAEDFGTAAPQPAAAGTAAAPVAPATGPLVTFSRNNKASRSRPNQTVLELSEELGIGIEFSCRVGTCGVCKVAMTSGEVEMAVDDALDAEDKAKGIILACQAKPKGDCVVAA